MARVPRIFLGPAKKIRAGGPALRPVEVAQVVLPEPRSSRVFWNENGNLERRILAKVLAQPRQHLRQNFTRWMNPSAFPRQRTLEAGHLRTAPTGRQRRPTATVAEDVYGKGATKPRCDLTEESRRSMASR